MADQDNVAPSANQFLRRSGGRGGTAAGIAAGADTFGKNAPAAGIAAGAQSFGLAKMPGEDNSNFPDKN